MTIYDFIALAACAIGGGLGAYAMINPAWASRIVRLTPTAGKVEGRSEFRASFGGLFLAGHAFAAWAITTGQPGNELAAAAIGAGWLGSSIGRTISLFADDTLTRLNLFNVAFELLLGFALILPLALS